MSPQHHFNKRIIFFYQLTGLYVPLDDFAFHNAFSDIRQSEFKRHTSPLQQENGLIAHYILHSFANTSRIRQILMLQSIRKRRIETGHAYRRSLQIQERFFYDHTD